MSENQSNQPAIRLERLTYTYPPILPGTTSAPALQDVDLCLPPGQLLAVMGPTGAGKTTLCLALNGLVPRAIGGTLRGNVWVVGYNTRHQPVAEVATRVGLVFQDSESQLFNMTVEDEVAFGLENLGLPAEEIERRVAWALQVVGLSDLGARSPAQLSGGQQRRLALAAVLAMRPRVLVLDEPTADLDPLGRQEIMAIIAGLREQGMSIVLATQDAEVAAQLADRVAVLDAGRLVLEGTPAQVFAQVDRLHSLGLEVPQLAELSWRLGIEPLWLTVEQAVQALSSDVGCRPGIASTPKAETAWPDTLPASGVSARPPAVGFEQVWYRYNGAPALAGVDLSIPQGAYTALVGANGSGKTTLAKHVIRLLQPERGRVLVLGQDTRRTTTGQLARRVGYVFQNPDHQLFAASVQDEVAFGPRNLGLASVEVERRVREALAAFDLTALYSLPPAVLSYGQRRLVTLAAAHAMQPQVLILDEPSVGLDRRLTGRLLDWVADLHRAGTMVLFITHDMRLAALARRSVVLQQGRVCADLPTVRLFDAPERLRQAGILPPPVVELGQRLGLPGVLTVDDFCRAWAARGGSAGQP